jgi:hypothetical protein
MFRNKRKMKRYPTKWISAATMLLVSTGSSLAQEVSPSAYRMAVIKDEAYGRVLLSGDYDIGIAKISSYSNKRARTFAAKNNLCVAYTLRQKFAEATPACYAALSISERYVRQGNSPIGPYTSRDQALAYSNRGVLRAVTGDFDGARQDFELATKVSADLETAAGNLARLESRQVTPVSAP